jgi:hypothetical protein
LIIKVHIGRGFLPGLLRIWVVFVDIFVNIWLRFTILHCLLAEREVFLRARIILIMLITDAFNNKYIVLDLLLMMTRRN